jgi:hypothetical protein
MQLQMQVQLAHLRVLIGSFPTAASGASLAVT